MKIKISKIYQLKNPKETRPRESRVNQRRKMI